ncbi:GTPase [Nostoc sp. FACHB-110]|uniref:GTPase n=1 Tax=Nostoc sp. FACHB-110 TaxID=2692834 RepID=UPI0016828F02|nr:GTPase [Nostoc sp. FACHB-110]MBD2437007.1 50S ribosome-binding GTPase [Nostoc sp. FACHB-110]
MNQKKFKQKYQEECKSLALLEKEEFEQQYQAEYKSLAQEKGKCNAMVIGLTGVGKSTLINSVFRFSKVMTGTGKPITKKIEKHSHPNSPITIYDTPGLEADEEKIKRTKEEVIKLIVEKRKQDINEHIHFVWYCVNDKSNRFQEAEEEWIKDLIKLEVPVIIVLTQTMNPKNSKLLDFIQKQNLQVDGIIPVLADPLPIYNNPTIPAYGLDELIEHTLSLFSKLEAAHTTAQAIEAAHTTAQAINEARKAFIAAQKVNVNLRISEAEKYLKGYVAGAGVAGSPISGIFGGLAVAGAQTAMIAHLTFMCGLEFKSSFLFPIYAACASVSIPTLIAVSIPGIDLLVGAPAAAIMTYLMGKALLFGYEKYLKAQITGNEMSKSELQKIIIDSYQKSLRQGKKTSKNKN